MPSFCAVFGCSNRAERNYDKSYYRLPSVKKYKGIVCPKRVKRRDLWLRALRRKDLTEEKLKYIRICSDHFVTGKPSLNENDVDYVPNINLGYDSKVESSSAVARRNRRFQKELNLMDEVPTELPNTNESTTDTVAETEPLTLEKAILEIEKLKQDLRNTNMENCKLKQKLLHGSMTEESFKDNAKTKFYTGLISYDCLNALVKKIQPYLTCHSHSSLNPFQQILLTLMRLRLNLKFVDLAYRFDVSRFTISRYFSNCLEIMYARMQPLVKWPDRDILKQTMPECFRLKFEDKVTVIIDCFEIFIQRSSNLSAQASTWSNYKHHNTIKILIEITPQGTISFISKAFGGRCSDKYVTEHCGILEKIEPDDLILADRGFLIYETVRAKKADLNIPHFLKGRKQLSPLQVEETRRLANVRIHVERVIGLLRQKYNILQNMLSMQFLSKNDENDNLPYIDKIIFVCCALVNLCPTVVSDSI